MDTRTGSPASCGSPPPGLQVHDATVEAGAYPSPYNYFNFPKSVCTSINEVICHGIPDRRPLQEGDIVNVDVSVFYKGYHGEAGPRLRARGVLLAAQLGWRVGSQARWFAGDPAATGHLLQAI